MYVTDVPVHARLTDPALGRLERVMTNGSTDRTRKAAREALERLWRASQHR